MDSSYEQIKNKMLKHLKDVGGTAVDVEYAGNLMDAAAAARKERVLGHSRIFQSVLADLELKHDADSQTYSYSGDVDPFYLEDVHFPITVAAINERISDAYERGHKDGLAERL